jgi:hypothetical protein
MSYSSACVTLKVQILRQRELIVVQRPESSVLRFDANSYLYFSSQQEGPIEKLFSERNTVMSPCKRNAAVGLYLRAHTYMGQVRKCVRSKYNKWCFVQYIYLASARAHSSERDIGMWSIAMLLRESSMTSTLRQRRCTCPLSWLLAANGRHKSPNSRRGHFLR